MRLWLEFLAVGVLLWLVSFPGTEPAIRLAIGLGALVWGVVSATPTARSR